jgi:hypothetical protein
MTHKEETIMAQKIILQPDEVWDYFVEHEEECDECMFEIASCSEYGTAVYLSRSSKGIGCITVEADDQEVYNEEVIDAEDTKKTVQKVYDDYLTDKVIEILSDFEPQEDDTLQDQEDEIAMREEELDNLIWDFVMGVFGGETYADFDCTGEVLDDLKDHFLEYMYRKHGFDIYRPMVLEDEDGTEFFEEYPYEHMVFDDEDNPMYKD